MQSGLWCLSSMLKSEPQPLNTDAQRLLFRARGAHVFDLFLAPNDLKHYWILATFILTLERKRACAVRHMKPAQHAKI